MSKIITRDGLTVVETEGEVKIGAMISARNAVEIQAAHDAMTHLGAKCGMTKDMDPEQVITFGGEIKALGNGKVGGYLVRNSTPNDPDLVNDYFDAETVIKTPDELPTLYHHGLNKTLGRRVIGTTTTKRDSVGLWAETQLKMRDGYEKAIYEMALAGKLGYSSGAINIQREQAGKAYHIKTWEIIEASLTPTPAEPRNGIVTLKSLIPASGGVAENADNKSILSNPLPESENEMAEPTVSELVAAEVTKALKIQADQAKAQADRDAEIKSATEAGRKAAIEEMKSKRFNPIAFNTQPLGFSEEKDAVPGFKAWLATGEPNGALIPPPTGLDGIKAAFNITTGASGGYMVPDPLYNQIIAKRNIASWVRMAPTQKFTTISDHLLVPVEDTSHTAFVLTNEAAAYNENEGTVAQVDLALLKYTKLIKVSEEFLAGENSGFEGWIAQALARAETVTENTVATTAILASATAGTAFASQTAVTIPEVERLIGTLGAGYNVQGETGFLMKNATKFYDLGLGYASYQQWVVNNQLGGYPVYISDDMPAMTTGLRSHLYGNFNYFGVIERPGMLIQRNPYLYMANGQVGIFANIYRGFGVLQAEAFYTSAQA